MASDTILNALFEIAQSETDEIVYFNDFSEELRNNFNELTNDEYDEALLVIHQQVKGGNKLLIESTGKISISPEIIVKAKNTVEYTKQLREHNSENTTEKAKMSEIILTAVVINEMIDNYKNLSEDEKNNLLDNMHNVDINKMKELLDHIADDFNESYKNAKSEEQKLNSKFGKEIVESFQSVFDTKNPDNVKKFFEEHPDILNEINEDNSLDFSNMTQEELENLQKKCQIIIEKIVKDLKEFEKLLDEIENQEQMTPEQEKRYEDLYGKVREYQQSYHKEFEEAQKEHNNERKKQKNSQENINSNTDRIETFTDAFRNEYLVQGDENKFQPEIQQLPLAFSNVEFGPEEIKGALTQYKNYFENLGEDDLQFLAEQTDVELAEILQSEFKEFEVDDRVAQILDIMSNINYHGEIGEILTSPEKREIFFAELDNAISMDMNVDKSSIVIQDSELAELFERASVDLQVADATQVREEGAQTAEFDSSYIEESDVNTMHLKNSVPMQVDTVFERLCDEALQEGAVLDNDAYEKLLQEYMNEQGLKKVEAKSNAPETKGEKAGEDNEHANSELPPIFENQNNLDETIVDSNVSKDSISEFTEFEEYVDEDGNTKKVAGLKKDEKGDITDVTVFNPLNFVKISGVTTAELQEQVDMVKTLTQERTAVTENKKDEHEDVIE